MADCEEEKEKREGQEAADRRRSVKVTLPGGIKLEIRGYDIILVAMIFGAGFLGNAMLEHRAEAKDAAEAAAIRTARNSELLVELRWILLQPQSTRDKYQLEIPESLRRDLVPTTSKRN